MPDPSQFNTDRTYPGRWCGHLQQPADQHVCSHDDRRNGEQLMTAPMHPARLAAFPCPYTQYPPGRPLGWFST